MLTNRRHRLAGPSPFWKRVIQNQKQEFIYLGLFELLLVGIDHGGIHLNLGRRQGRCGNELEVGIADQLSRKPQEGLLEVVVRLGRNVVILELIEINIRFFQFKKLV